MNYRSVVASLGVILIFIGTSMFLPFFCALFYGENDWLAYLCSGLITTGIGIIAYTYNKIGMKGDLHSREAIAIVAFSWLLASFFGTLPYLFTGTLTTFSGALFETMSGFTTTGASVITDIEALTHGILFWRSLTHWLGGMGIIVLFVAALSSLGVGGLQMYKAEATGLTKEKIKPRISETAKVLWFTYLVVTLVETITLWFLGMSLFDAICHAFSIVASGGFSTKNMSIGHYSDPLLQWTVIFFMFLSGVSFILMFKAFQRRSLKVFWKNNEFRLYTFYILIFSLSNAIFLLFSSEQPFGDSIKEAFFHVVTIMTGTGFMISDYNAWPNIGKMLLIIAMFLGGCSGSTTGAIKAGRFLILLKQSRLELQRVMRPRAILSAKINGKSVSPEMLTSVQQFFFMYMVVVGISTVIMSSLGLNLFSAFTSVVATLCNVGPGLDKVGPIQNYSFIPAAGKLYLSFLMLLGRLELYTILVLFLPSFWRK